MSGEGSRQPVDTEELFRSHASFVARFLHRFGVGPDELDDAVQEVFLVVHRHGGYTPGPATPRTYLASIAVRAASVHRRRARARRDKQADVAPEDLASAQSDAVERLETRESLVRLQAALDRLDPELRAVLILVELEGESCTAIAASQKTPVGTVYWRLHRARSDFRKAVKAIGLVAFEGARPEGRMEKMAIRSMLPWTSKSEADELLEVGRAKSSVRYDVTRAVVRHQALVRAGAPLPSWANGPVVATAEAGGTAMLALGAGSLFVMAAIGAGAIAHRIQPPSAGHVIRDVGPVSMSVPSAPNPAESRASGATPPAPRPAAAPRAAEPREHARVAGPPDTPAPVELRLDDIPQVAPSPGSSIRPLLRSGHASGQAMPPRVATTAPFAAPSASAPPPSPPPPASEATRADTLTEPQVVAAAEQALANDPAIALSLVRSAESRFPSGYLREESRYIDVMALSRLGRKAELHREAARFLEDYPDGPYSKQVRASLTQSSTDP